MFVSLFKGRLEVAVFPETQILMLLVSRPCWCCFCFLGTVLAH